jgi:hypothetical protein
MYQYSLSLILKLFLSYSLKSHLGSHLMFTTNLPNLTFTEFLHGSLVTNTESILEIQCILHNKSEQAIPPGAKVSSSVAVNYYLSGI